jgi:hypothetical protein
MHPKTHQPSSQRGIGLAEGHQREIQGITGDLLEIRMAALNSAKPDVL